MYSNEEGGNTEPVDMINRNLERLRRDSTIKDEMLEMYLVLYLLVRGNQCILRWYQMP